MSLKNILYIISFQNIEVGFALISLYYISFQISYLYIIFTRHIQLIKLSTNALFCKSIGHFHEKKAEFDVRRQYKL